MWTYHLSTKVEAGVTCEPHNLLSCPSSPSPPPHVSPSGKNLGSASSPQVKSNLAHAVPRARHRALLLVSSSLSALLPLCRHARRPSMETATTPLDPRVESCSSMCRHPSHTAAIHVPGVSPIPVGVGALVLQ
jgi:hypothetical protein